MNNRCEAFEELIWEHVRTGLELPLNVQSHIEHCASCAQTQREAKQLTSAMLLSDCVPDAPDCRRAVMARIAPPARKPRLAWVYACAGLALAGIATISVINEFTKITPPRMVMAPSVNKPLGFLPAIDKTKHDSPRVSVKPGGSRNALPKASLKHYRRKHQSEAPYMVAKLPDASPARLAAKIDNESSATSFSASPNKPLAWSKSSVSLQVKDKEKADSFAFSGDYSVVADAKAELDWIGPDDNSVYYFGDAVAGPAEPKYKYASVYIERPIAIAVVDWSTSNESTNNSYSYSYTDKDLKTGQVTNCSVNVSGDTIDINLESEPIIEQPSERGIIDHETSSVCA